VRLYIVGPAAVAAAYQGQTLVGVRVEVLYEAEGVKDRRGLLGHEFTEEGRAETVALLTAAGHIGLVTFEERIPQDWRYAKLI